MIKIQMFSDCHGELPNIKKVFDLLLIAGDITPAKYGYHSKKIQKEWLFNEFKQWIDALPYNSEQSKVFLVPGNHDFVFENLSPFERLEIEQKLGYRVELLIHEEKKFCYNQDNEFKELRIFGTPYCKIFGRWAFMHEDDFLEKAFSEIPEGLDILITHDPPTLNNMGKITQGRQIGKDAGNSILTKYVLEKKPKYLFSGHIHSGNHNFTECEGIMMANGSYVDETYIPWYSVLQFEI
jgi:Icc-related predicted phosphoesterase